MKVPLHQLRPGGPRVSCSLTASTTPYTENSASEALQQCSSSHILTIFGTIYPYFFPEHPFSPFLTPPDPIRCLESSP
jgi:hypothetical protein